MKWYLSEEYEPVKKIREDNSDGNVISTNAPRPSSDDIRELLNTNLQKEI